jgi:filamentous hemagglutinin family protein
MVAGPAAAEVVADGRSATQLIRSGAVTDIRTGTVSNGVGINSFSRFNVLSGEIANLFVPDSTNALVNIVRDQSVTINGMVNSYKNGNIGGNIFFASPNGFVVGPSGVVNVGRLTVSTPTHEFTERLLDGSGRVDQASLQQLRDGAEIPISSSGLISIQGEVNALEGISLNGSQVKVGAQAKVTAGYQAVPRIEELVNTHGLATGGALVARNGEIVIVAAGDVSIHGTVRADGQAGVAGGLVDINAGHDVLVDGGRVSASGIGDASSGGRIHVMAEHDATVRGGGVVATNAGTRGDGGALEFSGKNVVYWADGRLEASAHGGGALGEILIDPTDFVQSASQYTDGANLTLQADNSIIVSPDVVLSTRKTANGAADNQATAPSVGNSGKLTITASHITLGDGAKLYAQADNGYIAGDVSLIATSIVEAVPTGSGVSLSAGTAEAAIKVGKNVDIFGDKISLSAIASVAPSAEAALGVIASKDSNGNDVIDPVTAQTMQSHGVTVNQSSSSLFESVTGMLAGNGLVAAVQILSSNASIEIGDGARIVAKGDVSITASSSASAKVELTDVPIGVVVTQVKSNASVGVGAASIISNAGKVDIRAINSNTTNVAVEVSIKDDSVPLAMATVVSLSEGSASTHLGAGSVVSAAKSVTIGAEQVKDNSLSVSGEAENGAVVVGVVVDVSSLSASTTVEGQVTSGESMRIYASFDTASNSVSNGIVITETQSEADEGEANKDQKSFDLEKAKSAVSDVMGTLLEQLHGSEDAEQQESAPGAVSQFFKNWGIVGAVSVIQQASSASLVVKPGAVLKSGAGLELTSSVKDYLTSNVSAETAPEAADSEKAQETTSTPAADGKKNGVGVAVLVAHQDVSALTDIQGGGQVDAKQALSITATADYPSGLGASLDSLRSMFSDENSPFAGSSWTDKATDATAWKWFAQQLSDFEMANTRTQSSVSLGTDKAPVVDSGANISGSVAVSGLVLKSKTQVGSRVQINQDTAYRTDEQDVSITTKTTADLLNLVGDPNTLLGKSGDGAKTGLGASVGYNSYTFASETLVGDAVITGKSVEIKSENSVLDISGAASGASSGKNALGGSVLLNFLNASSIAHLGAGAVVNAGDTFNLEARDQLFYVGLGGAVMKSSANSFGFSVAYANISRNTEAAITGAGNGSIAAVNSGHF